MAALAGMPAAAPTPLLRRRPRSMPTSIRARTSMAGRNMKRQLARVLLARALQRITGSAEAHAA